MLHGAVGMAPQHSLARAQQGPPLKCPCGGDAPAVSSSLAALWMLKSTSELFLGQGKTG